MTDSSDKTVVFRSIRFDPALAERLGDYVHEKKKTQKTSLDAEVQRAVTEMLEREAGHPSQPKAPAPIGGRATVVKGDRYREWYELLDRLLEKATEEEKVWIRGNLRTFVKATRVPKEPAKRPIRKPA